jgi:hypothetical protein
MNDINAAKVRPNHPTHMPTTAERVTLICIAFCICV